MPTNPSIFIPMKRLLLCLVCLFHLASVQAQRETESDKAAWASIGTSKDIALNPNSFSAMNNLEPDGI